MDFDGDSLWAEIGSNPEHFDDIINCNEIQDDNKKEKSQPPKMNPVIDLTEDITDDEKEEEEKEDSIYDSDASSDFIEGDYKDKDYIPRSKIKFPILPKRKRKQRNLFRYVSTLQVK